MKKRTKKDISVSLLVVYAIVIIIYNAVFFMIPIEKNTPMWITYGFAMLSIAVSAFATYFVMVMGKDLVSKMYGIPVVRVGVVYAGIQVAFSILIMFIGALVSIPIWLILMLCIMMLCVAGIGLVATASAKTIIDTQDKELIRSTRQVREFRLNVDYLVDVCHDPVVKKEMEKLAEKFRYSDPVSSDALIEIEARLKAEIEVLGTVIHDDPVRVVERIRQIDVILADRNRRCKAYK